MACQDCRHLNERTIFLIFPSVLEFALLCSVRCMRHLAAREVKSKSQGALIQPKKTENEAQQNKIVKTNPF
jgi:hypothetical protein